MHAGYAISARLHGPQLKPRIGTLDKVLLTYNWLVHCLRMF